MMTIIMTSLLFGMFRAAHGSGTMKRSVAILLMAFFTILYAGLGVLDSLILIGGLFLGLSIGWGKYFSAMKTHWTYHDKPSELPIVEFFTDRISNDRVAGITAMSLRWFILFFPMFLLLGAPMYSIGLLSIGFLYALHDIHDNWEITEFITGSTLGLMVILAVL